VSLPAIGSVMKNDDGIGSKQHVNLRVSSVLFACCFCSPLVVPEVSGVVGHGYCRLYFIFSFLSTLFSHCVFYHQSPIASIFYCCSPCLYTS